MIIIGMDVAMRSNGIVAVKPDGELINMKIIDSDLNDEELINHIEREVNVFINSIFNKYGNDVNVNIERLSYNSFSAHKDLLAGIHWGIRSFLFSIYGIKVNVISPKEWQSKVIKTWDKVHYELNYPEQDIKKLIPYFKCPYKEKIDQYISSRDCIKKDAHYDLSDAYWIACHKK